MITKVVVENFKRFAREEFDLDETIVLAGPNNSGKSTLLQALSTWSLALERWQLGKGRAGPERGRSKARPKIRTGQPVTRKDFTAIPLREFDLLWNDTQTALSKSELGEGQKPGEPRLIHITVHGTTGLTTDNPWALTMELRYQSTEQIYVKPFGTLDPVIPPEASQLAIVHCPPFSGIGAEEKRMDRGAQNLEIGKGKPGDILRNLLLDVFQHADGDLWQKLVRDIQDLFRVTLLEPFYNEAVPFILCEYLAGIPKGKSKGGLAQFDIASGGSGFHQILLLLSFFYARPASVLLLDEPDAHLHVILQRQIYDRLRIVASQRQCQLLLATHSEVILDATAPTRVVSFLRRPHRLVAEYQRDQVREAMGRLTTLDLLLAEQGRAVLYCEGESDFDILKAWAEVLAHPAKRFFDEPFFHVNEGRNPRQAKGHLFALRAIRPGIRGLLLLDGDNRDLPEHEIRTDGLTIKRWQRYEIENYLLVPAAITRTIAPSDDMFAKAEAVKAIDFLKQQLPPVFFDNPLQDTAAVVSVAASKQILPQLFEAAGRRMEKSDFFLIASNMRPAEIHPEVVEILNSIVELLPSDSAEDGADDKTN
jgi:predicted ATPase